MQPDLLQDRFDEGGKTRNIAIQLVLQQCCKTSRTFFVAVLPYLKLFLLKSEVWDRETHVK